MTGVVPPERVRHLDGNPLNNQWTNLQLQTHAEHLKYRRRRRTTCTGVKGISKNYANDTWEVSVEHNGKFYNAGPFLSLDAALAAHETLIQKISNEVPKQAKPVGRVKFSEKEIAQAMEVFIERTERNPPPTEQDDLPWYTW